MSTNIFEPSINDLNMLSPEKSIQVLKDLILADAIKVGAIKMREIDVPSAITISDGGIDAAVTISNPVFLEKSEVIPNELTRYQVKTGKFSLTKSKIRELILKPESLRGKNKLFFPDDINPRVKYCFDNDGTFVLVLFGSDKPDKTENEAADAIRTLLCQIDEKYKSAKIEIWRQNVIIRLISRFPDVALNIKQHNIGFLKRLEYMKTKCEAETTGEYLKTPQHEEKISQIKEALFSKETLTHIRVVGEPGIGKTRFVYEAISESGYLPSSCYVEYAENLLSDGAINNLIHTVREKKVELILVVDECSPENRSKIHEKLKISNAKITLITIYNELNDQDAENPNFFYLELFGLNEPEISRIMQFYGLPLHQAKAITPWCSGSPRVAHVVGRNLKENPQLTSLIKLKGIDDIWKLYIVGHGNPDEECNKRKITILKNLALFTRFGWDGHFKSESSVIFTFIQKIEPSISSSEFYSVVEHYRNRRILQGSSTLYITPKLLHIKLWCDWWETYSRFWSEKNSLLQDLPDILQEAFYGMFIYAKESSGAEEIVKNLLSEKGPFYDINGYSDKFGDNFFLILSLINPIYAIKAVFSAISNLSYDDLIKFKNGRRQVVQALEKMALHEDCFEKAAECLIRLAEAENESWSNNATGVFINLFSLSYGDAAPTELSPYVRLDILKSYIGSPNERIRNLAFSGVNKSLEAKHFVFDIRHSIGFNEMPKGWTPGTSEELCQIYREYLKTLWNIYKQNKHNEQAVMRIILTSAYSLINIPIVNEFLLSIIEELSTDMRSSKKFPQELIKVIAHIHYYNSAGLDESIIEKLNILNNRLSKDSFSSKLRRYVGLNLIEDRKVDENEETINNLLPLAQEIFKDPTLLQKEISWLVTEQAENGYEFGRELASYDKHPLLWEIIYKEFISNKDSTYSLISGYLSKIFEFNIDRWEFLIEKIINDIGISRANFVICNSGMTRRISELMLKYALEGRFSLSELRIFIYAQKINRIDRDIFLSLLKLMIGSNDAKIVYTALELVFYRTRYDKEFKVENEFLDIVQNIIFHNIFLQTSSEKPSDSMIYYYWNEMAIFFLEQEKNVEKIFLKKCLENMESIVDFISYDINGGALEHAARKNPIMTWNVISDCILSSSYSNTIHMLSWLQGKSIVFNRTHRAPIFNLIPKKLILEWIQFDPNERGPLIATYLPIEIENFENSIVQLLLELYGDRKGIKESLSANFFTESWSGPSSIHFQNKLKGMEELKRRIQNRKVELWINGIINSLKERISFYQDREERYGY